MTTAASYATEHHWDLEPSHSRRCSTETVFSVQDRETDIARDTSDSEPLSSDSESGVEYEPVTGSEGEAPIDDNTSAGSDDDIIRTKVVEVLVDDDKDVQFADSERTDTYESDSEFDIKMDFVLCLRCKNTNTNPVYSYCQKCYHIRKSFFPPRPKRKRRVAKISKKQSNTKISAAIIDYPSSQASSSGYSSQALDTAPDHDTALESERNLALESDRDTVLVSDSGDDRQSARGAARDTVRGSARGSARDTTVRLKRRAESAEEPPTHKKARRPPAPAPPPHSSDTDEPVQPLVKTVSDPFITIDPAVKFTKKTIANTLLEKIATKDLCIVCVSQPKSGVFVHGRIAHICCCYKCAVKVWSTAKRCPLCNCRVSNVLRAVM